LGLGMFIGAQVAGKIEAQHTPPASVYIEKINPAAAVAVKALETAIAAAPEADKAKLQGDLAAKISEIRNALPPDGQAAMRKAELKSIEWKPLWGKPAAFAAIILVLFVVLFRNPPASGGPVKH
jgi:hypothetical protein